MDETARHHTFYSAADPRRYGRESQDDVRAEVRRLLDEHLPATPGALVLDLGAGAGGLAGIHPGYVALDYSQFAATCYLKDARAVCGDMQRLPFRTASVACVVSVAALEHVPAPEMALEEIDRVLRPGGLVYLAPAWFCRPWAARDLAGRPYRDLDASDRLAKASIPVRNSLLWRGLSTVSARLVAEIDFARTRKPVPFRYRRLSPNLSEYLTSDSDAFTSMDPHAAMLYFLSRGYTLVDRDDRWVHRLFLRARPLVLRKRRAG